MKPPSDFAIALRLAAHFAESLPEGCPFEIYASEDWDVDIEIPSRTRDEFWKAAIAINIIPEGVQEVVRSFGNLHVSLYLWEGPEQA